MIDHAEQGGRTTLVLRKAAREGAGGGLGPQFPGKGRHHVILYTGNLNIMKSPNVTLRILGNVNTHFSRFDTIQNYR